MINIRLPLDQYAYLDVPFEGTSDEALLEYKRLKSQFEGNGGLPQKEWVKLRRDYLNNGDMEGDPGDLDKLSLAQRYWVNETKKAFKLIKSKGELEE